MFKFNFKKAKTFLFALPLTIVFLSQTAFAANYTVTSGDTLNKIAGAFNTTANAIMQDNSLKGETIYPGQVLYVPGSTYTVKSGDSLYLIAKSFGISLNSLRSANHKWDNTIYAGEKLAIPAVSKSDTASQSNGVISYTANDLDLLARLITAEAQGQPYNAQVAVGAVVVNRTKDSRFPKTISGVIYEVDNGYYQFTPVQNGWINKPATADAKQAAYDALHGVDPTHGAVYYFDDSTTNKWLWSKPIATRIGNMVYTY
ncbi:MAG: LysM peptidoglycan-binding domain-containing protein [Bacillota bacterium]|nr:LysM peptidoglycan-binding domain-containing protein [Bacillota bacterium]